MRYNRERDFAASTNVTINEDCMKPITLSLLIPLYLAVSACATEPTNPETSCTSPRPQVCTMQYDPVCATLKDGAQATYSSGCNACADVAVKAYLPGGTCEALL